MTTCVTTLTFGNGLPCPVCDGKGEVDDRGFPLRGQPYFDTKPCSRCGGSGRAFLVVGFEGGAGDDVPVTFGAAALHGDGVLINPALGTSAPIEDLEKLVGDGAVTRTAEFAVALARAEEPLYVLRYWEDDLVLRAAIAPAVADFPAWRTFHEHGGIDHRYVLFPSLEVLEVVGAKAAEKLREVARSLSRIALVLDPWEGLGKEEWVKTRKGFVRDTLVYKGPR